MSFIEIEFYQEDGVYFACIGGENSSNYDISGESVEDVAEKVKNYILDYVDFPGE